VAWLLSYGCWPESQVDHINGLRSDNRLVNLRAATASENSQNMRGPMKSNRTSKFLGVSWKKREQRWCAQIQVAGKRRHLGLFADEDAASRAYLAAKRELHPYQTLVA